MTNSTLRKLQEWIGASAGQRDLMIPVSGGTDSALSFWLCQQVLPGQTNAVHFGERLRARAWFESFGPVETVPMPADPQNRELGCWAELLALSSRRHAWLVGSRNRTEDVFGTFSLVSRVATYFPIVSLWKTEVMALCELAGVPEEILQSSRRPDIPCGRTELMTVIGFEKIDRFLQVKTGESSEESLSDLPPEHRHYLEDTYQRGQFKRKLPMRAPRF